MGLRQFLKLPQSHVHSAPITLHAPGVIVTVGHHPPELIAYLQRDLLQHIVHLKVLATYGRHVQATMVQHGEDAGVLLVLPTSVTTYESVAYPLTKYVVYVGIRSPLADR